IRITIRLGLTWSWTQSTAASHPNYSFLPQRGSTLSPFSTAFKEGSALQMYPTSSFAQEGPNNDDTEDTSSCVPISEDELQASNPTLGSPTADLGRPRRPLRFRTTEGAVGQTSPSTTHRTTLCTPESPTDAQLVIIPANMEALVVGNAPYEEIREAG
ncbi:hypothetical protein FRB90_011535, partial [Tulasnella sp. 427]